jgi:hypothetical protein
VVAPPHLTHSHNPRRPGLVFSSLSQAAAAAAAAAASAAPSLRAAAPAYGLYGLSADVSLIRQYTNGTAVAIGAPLANDLQAQQLSTIDEAAGVLYAIFYDDTTDKPMFTGVSLATGKVVSSVPVPFAESSFVGVGQLCAWEPRQKALIAGGQLANASHVIGLVDPVSGAWTHLATLNSTYLDVLGGASAFASSTGELLFQLGVGDTINIFALNTQTGAVQQYTQDFDGGHDIVTMDYDPTTGDVFGLGIMAAGSSIERTVTRLHTGNYTISLVGKVPDYTIESGGIAALNVASRTLYWIGQKSGGNPGTAPFYLIGNSIVNASVVSVSAGALCTSDPGCPWSLEYLNAKF